MSDNKGENITFEDVVKDSTLDELAAYFLFLFIGASLCRAIRNNVKPEKDETDASGLDVLN